MEKAQDDPVYAATVNASGSFEYRVTAAAGNTTLARIIHAVEQAQSARAPTQRFVDQFANIYTPAVFVMALAVAALGPWVAGWTVLQALYKALVLLVVGVALVSAGAFRGRARRRRPRRTRARRSARPRGWRARRRRRPGAR